MKAIIIIISVCFSLTLAAQSPSPLQIKNTAKGLFVVVNDRTLLNQPVELYRKATGEAAYKKIATLTVHESQTSLEKKISEAQSLFRTDAAPKPEGISDVWKAYKSNSDTLKAFIVAVPQLAYVFNKAYMDTDVKIKTTYQYQVMQNGKVLMTSERVTCNKRYAFPDLTGLTDTTRGRYIVFRLPSSDDYNLYVDIVGKRKLFTDRQNEFAAVKLSLGVDKSHKITSSTLTDNTLKTISEFDYQLQLRNIFGELDTMVYNYSASNVPRQLYVNVTSLKAVPQKDNHMFRIRWKLSDPKRVQSMTLFKSDKHDGKFIPVQTLASTDSAVSDRIDIANELYFYYLEVTDVMGKKTRSAQIHAVYQGDYVPTPAYDLTAATGKRGITLDWRASDKYTRGFYVFRSIGTGTNFQQVSPFISVQDGKGTFTDSTTQAVGTAYYYTVKAESDTYQKSIFSDTITIRSSLEKNAVKPPLDINAVFRAGKVMLTWENLSIQWPNVAGYHVYRRKASEQNYTRLTARSITLDNSLTDSTVLSAIAYQYAVTSVDGDGNESLKSLPVKIDLSQKFVVVPEKLGMEILPAAIKLRWTSIDTKQIKDIQIYRAEGDANFKLLTTVAKDSRDFTDKAVKKGSLYSYRIVTTSLEGKESNPTRVLLVQF